MINIRHLNPLRGPHGLRLAGLLVFTLLISTSIHAQTTAFWLVTNGVWNDANNWSGGIIPNNGGGDFYNVIIESDPGDQASVTISSGFQFAVDSITLGAQDELVLENNSGLLIDQDASRSQSGQLVNLGTIRLNAGANFTDFNVENDVSLSGGGTLVMSGANARILDEFSAGDGHLTNVDNLIRGQGMIGLNRTRITNQAAGVIEADVGGAVLTIDNAPNSDLINRGILQATNGGILRLTGGLNENIDNAGGTIQALNHSTVELANQLMVTGGQVATAGTGRIVVNPASTVGLIDATIDAQIQTTANSNLNLTGDIDNRQSIVADSTTGPGFADLRIQSTTHLTGGGTLQLSGPDARIVQEGTGNGFLTNVDNRIEGQGWISALRLDNQTGGVIDANVFGQTLRIQTKGGFNLVNRGVIRASNGGVLRIDGIASGLLDNTGAEIQAQDQSLVQLGHNLIIQNGSLVATGSGRFATATSSFAYLDDVAVLGPMEVTSSTLSISGQIVHPDTTTLGLNGRLIARNQVTLSGGGTITLADASSALNNDNSNSGQVTNVDTLIQGQGRMATRLINQSGGMVDANVNGATLIWDTSFLSSGNFDPINEGIYQASQGGTLRLSQFNSFTGTFLNHNGIIQALDNSKVEFGQLQIDGGEILAHDTGQLAIARNATSTFNDLTLDGALTVDRANLYFNGNIVNRDAISLSDFGRISTRSEVNLSGGGSISLATANDTIHGHTGSHLVNVDNTIEGQGTFTARLTNQTDGLVDANINGGTFAFDTMGGFDLVNRGIMQARNGAILSIDDPANGTNILDNANGIVQALDGSIVRFTNGLRVHGGVLRTQGSGEIQVVANNQFQFADLTIDGMVSVAQNAVLQLDGSIENLGNTIVVDGTNSSSWLRLVADATLTGGGTILLDGPNATIQRGNFQGQAIGNLINVDNTIEGQGQIGLGSMLIDNRAAGGFEANVNGATLAIDAKNDLPGVATAMNDGTWRASNGGTLMLLGTTGGEFAGRGSFEALDNSRLMADPLAIVQNFGAAGNLTSGTWRSIDQGQGAVIEIQNPMTAPIVNIGSAANVELSGFDSLFRVANTSIDDSILSNQGQLILRNGRLFDTSASFTNSGQVVIDGALTEFNIVNEFIQSQGETRLIDGALLSSISTRMDAGMIAGNGTVAGHVEAAAGSIISPGQSTGVIEMLDDATIAGTIRMQLGGYLVDGVAQDPLQVNSTQDFTSIEFDQLNILGGAELVDDAILEVSLIDGFTLIENGFFDLITANQLNVGEIQLVGPGGFELTYDVLRLPDPTYGGMRDVLRLNVSGIPEPASTSLMLVLAAGWLARCRRRAKSSRVH